MLEDLVGLPQFGKLVAIHRGRGSQVPADIGLFTQTCVDQGGCEPVVSRLAGYEELVVLLCPADPYVSL